MLSVRFWYLLLVFCTLLSGESVAQGPIFRHMFTPSLHGLPANSGDWGDFDGDGDFDLAITGNDFSGVYRFLKDTTYVTPKGTTAYESKLGQIWLLPPLQKSMTTWADLDNDGTLDLFLSGMQDGGGVVASVHRNVQGMPVQMAVPIALFGGAVTPGDFDNDGDTDLAMCGVDSTGVYRMVILDNRVSTGGGLAPVETFLPGIAFGSLDWGDYDRDGDLDLLYAGHQQQPQRLVSGIFRNDGHGVFVDAGIRFGSLLFAHAAWGDADSDGDLDVLITGAYHSPFIVHPTLNVFQNTGGVFSDQHVNAAGTYLGAAGWGDYDSDGLVDIVVAGGYQSDNNGAGYVYQNLGGLSFKYLVDIPGKPRGDVFWGDYDGDNDLDLCSTGYRTNNFMETYVRNELTVQNDPPDRPSRLRTEVNGHDVTFFWAPTTDDHTPVAGLSYNLRVGTLTGMANVMPSLANSATGKRYVARRGNVDASTQWTLHDLPAGSYYWSVQAIDTGFIGSAFADEASFTITP